MNKIFFYFFLITILVFNTSCQKNDDFNATQNDCVFIQNDLDLDGRIDDVEANLIAECSGNLLTTKAAIEENLIGNWRLIGYANGWQQTSSQPCAFISITENELIFSFENATINTTSTHQWEIEAIEFAPGLFSFKIITSPEPEAGLYISQFCASYMYSNATSRDGDMYLYSKVE